MKPTLAMFGPEGEIARVDPGSEVEALWRSRGVLPEAVEEVGAESGEAVEELGSEAAPDAPAPKRRGRKPKEASA
jgi:hypothetical protein